MGIKATQAGVKALAEVAIAFASFSIPSKHAIRPLPMSVYTKGVKSELRHMALFLSLMLYALYSPLRAAAKVSKAVALYRKKLTQFEKRFSTDFDIDSIKEKVTSGRNLIKQAKDALAEENFNLLCNLLLQIEECRKEIAQLIEEEIGQCVALTKQELEKPKLKFAELTTRVEKLSLPAADRSSALCEKLLRFLLV